MPLPASQPQPTLAGSPRFATSLVSPQGRKLHLASPLLNASGTFNPDTFARLFPLGSVLGGIVTKTLTPHAQPGNAQQRTVELPGVGMLNSIGLQGKGLAYWLANDLATLQAHGLPIILSLSAHSEADFVEALTLVAQHPLAHSITAVELNLSCPNVKAGGSLFGSSAAWVGPVVAQSRQAIDKPLWVKLTPNVTDVRPIAEAALAAGADGLVAINTVMGAHVDIHRGRLSLSKGSGGYSGPGIFPIALHHVVTLRQAFPTVPILGVGGITTWQNVVAMLMAGANAVQIGTSCFANPNVFVAMAHELDAFAQEQGIANLSDWVGVALP